VQQILSITGPIYLIIALGFLSVRFGLFAKPDMRVLGRFVIDFCLPALLFNALSQRNPGEVLNGTYLLAYASGSLLVLFAVIMVERRIRGKPIAQAALNGLGMSSSNSGFIGYPILLQLIGPVAAVALALTMIVENLLVMPLAIALADSGKRDKSGERTGASTWRHSLADALKGLLRNPMVIAILAGFGFAVFGLKLPEPAARTVQIIATASSPVALFVIGGSLVGLKLAPLWRDVAGVAIGKLVLHPAAVLVMLMLLPPIDPALRVGAVVLACAPMLSIYPLLAQKHHYDGFCAAALLAATMLSFATISGVLALLHTSGWLGA
jgi:malonate transporter and related proteins